MRAVDGVSLDIARGETVGLVGESGCGKSTFARAVLGLIRPTGGEVVFDGTSLGGLRAVEMRRIRRRMQMIFQDSFASLSPRMKVGDIIAEPIDIHRRFDAGRRRRRIEEVMRLVGLDPALASRYPHEFSGGQRQRINIARALAPEPEFLVCDEPVSSLDVSIQAQIINLLESLQRSLGLALLFISHDLAVVRHLCDRIAVMYLGRLSSRSRSASAWSQTRGTRTRARCCPRCRCPIRRRKRSARRVARCSKAIRRVRSSPPAGCRFCTRCRSAPDVMRRRGIDCARVEPILAPVEDGHDVACHLHAG